MDLQTLLQTMVNKRASDLHIRAGGPAYLRVDGELRPVSPDSIPAADAEEQAAFDKMLAYAHSRTYILGSTSSAS